MVIKRTVYFRRAVIKRAVYFRGAGSFLFQEGGYKEDGIFQEGGYKV